jgi:hypothetical protein
MARPSSQIVLSAEGRRELERLARAPRTQSLLLAKALGDISDDEVWRVLRKFGISLQRRRSWCVSTDPEFAAGFRCSALNPCAEQASPQLKTSLPISRLSLEPTTKTAYPSTGAKLIRRRRVSSVHTLIFASRACLGGPALLRLGVATMHRKRQGPFCTSGLPSPVVLG